MKRVIHFLSMNELARRVTKREGLKESLSVAQVKEVLRCLRDEVLANRQSFIALFEYLGFYVGIGKQKKGKRS